MRERNITKGRVEFVVRVFTASGFRNRHGNWQYEHPGTGLIVVLNDGGVVVTVFYR